MKEFDLDERRKEILAATGHIVIEGGPGCGKTTIALLKAAACSDKLDPEQRILFLSFSRAAVRQVTDRMRTTLTTSQRSGLEVRTFHSFFLDLVRSQGRLLTGTPARFITPEREAILRVDFDGDDEQWRIEKRRLASEDSLYVFDTLAPAVASLLERSADLRTLYSTRYPVIVVDEFQDTSTDQWRFVQALCPSSTIICLADPDQRIFDHIEGVDEHRLEDAKRILDPQTFDLSSDNHRSPASGILEYANAVLRDTPTKAPQNVVTATYRYHRPEILTHYYVQEVLASQTTQLPTKPTVAVLTRVNAFAGRISEAMTEVQDLESTRLEPIDHILYWDPELAAASALVIASILEWPTLSPTERVLGTLDCIADYYRVKVGLGTAGARSKITTLERATKAIKDGKNPAAKTAKELIALSESPPPLTGRAVTDWHVARAALKGSAELDELARKVRLVRLLNATGAVAQALAYTWNGVDGYTGAVDAVRMALAAEAVEVQQPDEAPVDVMTIHKSKGKEFDAVVIVEGRHDMPLLSTDPGSKAQEADRRLLRVAITRARHLVVFIRPTTAFPLTPPPGP